MRRNIKKDKKLELIAGILAGIGALFLAVGAFNHWFVIVSYFFFLTSAVIYIWWSRKYKIMGVLIMNIAYAIADLIGTTSWIWSILK